MAAHPLASLATTVATVITANARPARGSKLGNRTPGDAGDLADECGHRQRRAGRNHAQAQYPGRVERADRDVHAAADHVDQGGQRERALVRICGNQGAPHRLSSNPTNAAACSARAMACAVESPYANT